MATVHKLSVITNSCIKPPVDPKSGLSTTVDKRADASLSSTWHGKDADYNDVIRNGTKLGRSINFDTSNSMMETMNVDLADLTDDEFYERLLSLKNEHKKTLELCENLYSEKLQEFRNTNQSPQPRHVQVPVSVATVDADYSVSVQPEISFHEPQRQRSLLVDNVKDFSMTPSKPPTGRPQKLQGELDRSGSVRNSRQAWTRQSNENERWRSMSASSSEGEEIIRRQSRSRSRSPKSRLTRKIQKDKENGVSHIEDMWDNFSVEEYAPRTRSASMSRMSDPAREENATDTWQHRITVPKPFKMTLREANKSPKKTRAMEEIERKMEAKKLEEEEECQKKFKAKPVPAHVYMPLFDEIMEEKEAKRRYIKQHCAELIQSMIKPFKFDTRDERQKNPRRSRTFKDFEREDSKPSSTQFRANPFPEHIFDNSVPDRVREEEEYRKIRMQIRSEEMLRASSLPNNMKSRGKSYTEGKSRQKMYAEKAKKAGFTRDHKFKPQINKGIPNFEEEHRKFMKEVANAKYQREATVCKPFKLQTERISDKKHRIYDDISNDEQLIKERNWRFHDNNKPLRYSLTGSLSTSMDSIPARMTTSAQLRTSSTKDKMKKQMETEVQQLEAERRRRVKEQQLKKSIAERAAANDQSTMLKDHTKIKLKEYKESERMRQQEYRRQMNDMKDRVQERPLLFERTTQNNAKQAAERKYCATLKAAGLDEDFVTKKSAYADVADEFVDSEEEESYLKSFGSRPMSASTTARTLTGSVHTHSSRKYTEEFENDQTDEGSDISEEIMDG